MFDKELVGKLYEEAGMLKPENIGILNHILGVAHVAGLLARQLSQHNVIVNVERVETSGALHDIGKALNESDQGYVIEGVKFLHAQGVDEQIVQIVQKHQVYSFKKGEIPDSSTWEEKLVFLADCIFGGHIVPMKERVEDIISRYPTVRKKWLRENSRKIYNEILEIISPQTLPF